MMAVKKPANPEPVLIVVRSTVNLQGLPRDRIATVDPTQPDIQKYLRNQWLVPLPADQQPYLNSDLEPEQP